MKSIKLFQLGDVHFPESKGAVNVDHKDKSLSANFINALSSPNLKQVIRSIREIATTQTVDGVLICGDLTSKGNLAEYGPCVDYLIQSLSLGSVDWPVDSVHVVPGNHDINRNQCDPLGIDLFRKFTPLKAEWDRNGLPIFVADNIRTTSISRNACNVQVYSLNSCIGCRETRSLPHPIKADFEALLDKYHLANPLASFELLGEQLDTPAFHADHIDDLLDSIQKLPQESIPVVLSHHNILPQALLRIDLYTEVINGGPIRTRLSNVNRRIIYCHGHIHTDPIEIITNPRAMHSGLVCVSAPELDAGYNVLEFVFNNVSSPIGLLVSHYRLSSFGGVSCKDKIRIPLVSPCDASALASAMLPTVLSTISSSWDRFAAIHQRCIKKSGVNHPASTIGNYLLEAEWFSLIEIMNREQDCKHWTIRRLQP